MTPAGRYQLVPARFWQMAEVKGLSDDARMVLVYLWTSPHANMVWYYHCPLAYMLEDLGWAEESRLRNALDELAGPRLVHYDHENRVVFVALALADRPPSGSKQLGGAVAAVLAVVASPLREVLLEVAAEVCPALTAALRYPTDRVAIGYPAPGDTPPMGHHSDSDSDTVSDSDSESGTEEEHEEPTLLSLPPDMTPQERGILHGLQAIDGYPFDVKVDLKVVRRWLVRFPQVDLASEIDRCLDWWAGKPKGNWRGRLGNWFRKAESDGRESERREPARASGGRPVGYYDRVARQDRVGGVQAPDTPG